MTVEPAGTWSNYEDEISDAIADSIDMDWSARDGAKAVVQLLEALAAAPAPAPSPDAGLKMMVDQEWLNRRVENDPDLPCEAGPNPSPDAGVVGELLEAFDYVFGLLDAGAAGAIEREADTYVLQCRVNVGELRRVRDLRAALARVGEGR